MQRARGGRGRSERGGCRRGAGRWGGCRRCVDGAAGHDAPQLVENGIAARDGSVGGFDELMDMVLGVERHAHQRRGDRTHALADPVEGGFELVDEGGHGGEAEHGPGALDGMQGAEGRIDQIGIGGILLEIEQARLELVEQFASFLAEGLAGIGQVHAPVTFLMMARS